MRASGFDISAVEREVGLSKDVLRVWERRYGFPTPERAPSGERQYSAQQVERLRLIKRLMDQGHRPGKLLASSARELEKLASAAGAMLPTPAPDGLERLVARITQHDVDGFLQGLRQRLARAGLAAFVQDTVAPLSALVGVAWQEGRLEVFEEHLFTELTERVLRQAIAALPAGDSPRVLLTTAPNEQHAMGLLMVEALLALEGAHCVSLGTQTPLVEIGRAAKAHRADIVALSFSMAYPRRQVGPLLSDLRRLLPRNIEIWAGGGGMRRVTPVEGVQVFGELEATAAAIARWRP
jgi:MerR family transcriptional regulator, light-induced transcriptional regulator